MKNKIVTILCKAADELALDDMVEFQGGLKHRGPEEIRQMITSIEKYGFSFPFYVWKHDGKNKCLDGPGRLLALAEMRKQGWELPLFPVAYIDATDEADAKQRLLRVNSQYGQMTVDSVLEFVGDMEVDFGELALPSGVMRIEAKNAGNTDSTREIDVDAMEMTNKCPKCGYEFDGVTK